MKTNQKIIFSMLIIGLIILILLIINIKISTKISFEIPSEIGLIRTSEFKQLLDEIINSKEINENGAAGRNLDGFLAVAFQRVATRMIMKGIADDNEELIEKGIKAIEYGFEYQNDDGSFQDRKSVV